MHRCGKDSNPIRTSVPLRRALDFDSLFFTNGLDEFCKVLGNGAISSGNFKQHLQRLQIVVHGLCEDFR